MDLLCGFGQRIVEPRRHEVDREGWKRPGRGRALSGSGVRVGRGGVDKSRLTSVRVSALAGRPAR